MEVSHRFDACKFLTDCCYPLLRISGVLPHGRFQRKSVPTHKRAVTYNPVVCLVPSHFSIGSFFPCGLFMVFQPINIDSDGFISNMVLNTFVLRANCGDARTGLGFCLNGWSLLMGINGQRWAVLSSFGDFDVLGLDGHLLWSVWSVLSFEALLLGGLVDCAPISSKLHTGQVGCLYFCRHYIALAPYYLSINC